MERGGSLKSPYLIARCIQLNTNILQGSLANIVGTEPIFAVLEVKTGKLFPQKKKDLSLYPLLKGEAKSFETQWEELK